MDKKELDVIENKLDERDKLRDILEARVRVLDRATMAGFIKRPKCRFFHTCCPICDKKIKGVKTRAFYYLRYYKCECGYESVS